MDTSKTTIEFNKTSYTFDLTNTQNINNWADMAPFSTAVSNFIETWSLASFTYPEVYEFFVSQRNVKTEENGFGIFVFKFKDEVSYGEQQAIILTIRKMTKEKRTFIQLQNS